MEQKTETTLEETYIKSFRSSCTEKEINELLSLKTKNELVKMGDENKSIYKQALDSMWETKDNERTLVILANELYDENIDRPNILNKILLDSIVGFIHSTFLCGTATKCNIDALDADDFLREIDNRVSLFEKITYIQELLNDNKQNKFNLELAKKGVLI